MNDKVISSHLGFGLMGAHDAIDKSKKVSTDAEKIALLTEAIEILLGHLEGQETQRSFDEMNRHFDNM